MLEGIYQLSTESKKQRREKMKKVQENQKNQKKKNKGFTLVELIIVIAIIAILAIVLAPQYIKYVEKSRWSNDVNQMNELVSMVKTAIVEAQEKNAKADEVTGSIKVSKGTMTTTGLGVSTKGALDSTDGSWSAYTLKNNGNHGSEAGKTTPADGDTDTYTITIAESNGIYTVTGEWE